MPEFNGRIYFIAALYHVRGSFSRLPDFIKHFAPQFKALPFEQSAVLEKVRQLREEYSHIDGVIGQEQALKLMLAEDLFHVEQVLLKDEIASEINKRKYIKGSLEKCRDRAVDQLLTIGIHLTSPGLYFVEELPPPYAGQGYSSFVADQEDYNLYGIKPGVYFAENHLRPFYSEYLLFHELIHVALSKNNPEFSARGLEEGLAELIGAMYLSSKILGKELTTNLFIYNRLGYGQQSFWELYMDVTRQASMLYNRFGLQGIVHLVNSGRKKLKEVENSCLHMNFEHIYLPKGQPDNDLTDIADFLTMAFSRSLVVSPLAKYLTHFVRPHSSIEEILQEANVDQEAGKRALIELKRRVYLVSFLDTSDNFDAEFIHRTDCDWLSEGALIRYEVTEPTRT